MPKEFGEEMLESMEIGCWTILCCALLPLVVIGYIIKKVKGLMT